MPANVVRSPHEEKMWRQAKAAAKREGRAQDWAYIMATFERMKARVGGEKGRDAYRDKMHRNKQGRLVLKRGVDTLQGAEDNPQVADPADNSRITEQGVVDPKTPVEMPTMPGTIRVYKDGKPTKYGIHPEAEPKPMVYSKRAVIKAQRSQDAGITLPGRLPKAYDAAYRAFHQDEPKKEPRWSLRAEGSQGTVWRSADGWGHFYFWVHPNGRADYLGHKMPDVRAYHFDGPLKTFAQHLGITRKAFAKKLGFGDAKWDALMRRLVASRESPSALKRQETQDAHHRQKAQTAERIVKSGPNQSEAALIEELAEQIHNIWMSWAVHASESVDAKTRKRWKPMFVPYATLPESEKQKDRVEAMALLDVVRENPLKKSRAVLRKASSADEHWITIHPNGAEAKGRPVLIDSQGRILGGRVPKSAQGQHVTAWWKKQGTPEPKLHEHLREHSVAFTHHEAGHLTTGHGYQEGLNKWGKPEAAPGHVKVLASKNAPGYFGLHSAFADKDQIKALGARFGPQIGVDSKAWYLPIDKLPTLLKEFPHAEVSPTSVARYEAWAQAQSGEPSPAIKRVEAAAAHQAQRAEQGTPFTMPSGMNREAMTHGDLHPYQKAGVQFLLDQKRAILGHGVGLGKTLESLTAARAAQAQGAGPFLILCPSSRKYGWQDEIQKFSDASSVVLDAGLTPKQQQARWAQIATEKPDFIITNYETLQKPELAEKLHMLAPNVIADEAHRVKNSKAKTTKGFQQWKDARYAWLLTATPFPNGQPAETYTMLSHTQPDVVGSWKRFARDHVVFQEVSTPFGKVQKPVALKNIGPLREKLQKVVQIKQMTDPDVGLQLPDRRRVDVRLDMTKDQQKMYTALADQMAGEIAGMSEEDFQRASSQVLVKLKRLEQIALDPDLVRAPDQRTGDLSPKESWALETIADHLSDPKNRGMVVFCDTRMPLEKMYAGLSQDGVSVHKITGSESPAQRQETERQFSAGKVQVVLATSAAEEGMNLQHGSHTLMHLDVPWVPKSITQREGRIHRQGQSSPFTTHFHVTHGGTVEDTKQGTLSQKARDIDALLGTHNAEDVAIGHALSRQEVLAMLRHGSVQKSARNPRGVFIRASGAAHKRAKGFRPNPKHRMKGNRPHPSAMPGEIGPGHANVMQESSMQVMHAITQSKRRNPHPDWGFDPAANLPGNTQFPKPVGKPNIFVYKSNPEIAQAIHDYAALLDHGKTPIVALQRIGQRWPWVLGIDSARSRDWWAAVRRADLPRPPQFQGVDTEIDADNTEAPRKKGRAVFWREGPANLGQGIMPPTGSGGAGR